MPVFKYIGEKKEMKNCYGYDFSNWEKVTVRTDDKLAISKLSNNSHFKEVKKKAKKA